MDDAGHIAVVVPAYQAENFLLKALDSVAKQSVLPDELIIVDDGSTDRTCAVVEQFSKQELTFPVQLLRERHRGPGASRNTGILAARSKWIALLDADDLWHSGKLWAFSRAAEAHPEANFFCHNERIRHLSGTEGVNDYSKGLLLEQPFPPQLFRRNRFSTSAVICRRDLLLRSGGFDETLASGQDYELWLRLSPDLIPIFMPEILGTYVMRSGNISTRRYWRRLLNLVRVRHRHREKTGRCAYLLTQCEAVALHLLGPTVSKMRRSLNSLVGKGNV